MICLNPNDPWYGQDSATYGYKESMYRFNPSMFTNGICNVQGDVCQGMTLEQINLPNMGMK